MRVERLTFAEVFFFSALTLRSLLPPGKKITAEAGAGSISQRYLLYSPRPLCGSAVTPISHILYSMHLFNRQVKQKEFIYGMHNELVCK